MTLTDHSSPISEELHYTNVTHYHKIKHIHCEDVVLPLEFMEKIGATDFLVNPNAAETSHRSEAG